MGSSKFVFNLVLKKLGTKRLHTMAANARCKELALELRSQLGTAVSSGLFEGMILPDESSWGDSDFIAKKLGTYEFEIRKSLRKAVERTPAIVINVGCAEGYYAIGLARLLPNAMVYAFDIDAHACEICSRAAAENGVADRIVIDGLCTTERLAKVTERPGPILIVMDCEGAERELLDPAKVPGLAHSDIIVETHDCPGPDIAETLENRFHVSHDVQRIDQGGRNPNEIKDLARFHELDRWIMINENRSTVMTWLACWSRR
jgi:hypothetical protein